MGRRPLAQQAAFFETSLIGRQFSSFSSFFFVQGSLRPNRPGRPFPQAVLRLGKPMAALHGSGLQ